MDEKVRAKLDALYLDPSKPCSFSGFNVLWSCARNLDGITRSIVRDYLNSQPTYNRLKRKRHRFKRRPFLAFALNSIWQGDLADVSNLSRWNVGVKYLVVLVDTLSSFVRLRPCRSKAGPEVAAALDSVLSSGPSPRQLAVDHGLEFWNRHVFQTLRQHNVLIYSTQNSDIKCAQAERMIRTLKNRLYRLASLTGSKRYIDSLDDIATAINNSVNRSIKMKPKEVTPENEKEVFETRYRQKLNKPKYKFRFSVGDVVRTALPRDIFRKESEPQYSRSLHRVADANATQPHTYRVEAVDAAGTSVGLLHKAYYSPELSKVSMPIFDQKLPTDVRKRKRPIV